MMYEGVNVDEITHAHATTYESVLAGLSDLALMVFGSLCSFNRQVSGLGMVLACAEYTWRIFCRHSGEQERETQQNTTAQAM
jgi:hypothetical protein